MSLTPYKNWTRKQLVSHCLKQADEYGFDPEEIRATIYDERWIPEIEFNGCTLVQDPLHPFYPCLKHDFDWIVGDGGIEADKRFYNNLKKAGLVTVKARVWYIGVRLGWIFWYKWM